KLEPRLGALDLGENFLLAGVQLGAINVITSLQNVRRLLLLGQAVLGAAVLDVRLSRLELRLFLLQCALQICSVELDHYVARFDHGAGGNKLDDLQVAGDRRRGQLDRVQRLDLSADLDVVHELAPLHFRRRYAGCAGAMERDRPEPAQQEPGRRQQSRGLVSYQESHDGSVLHQLGFRSSTAPFSTPETITSSTSLPAPVFTSRRSWLEPFFTMTKCLLLSVMIVSRGATSTLGWRSSSMSTAAERSGRSLASVPAMEKCTIRLRDLPEKE